MAVDCGDKMRLLDSSTALSPAIISSIPYLLSASTGANDGQWYSPAALQARDSLLEKLLALVVLRPGTLTLVETTRYQSRAELHH